MVGVTSANFKSMLCLRGFRKPGSFETRIKGTGFVVCSVCGEYDALIFAEKLTEKIRKLGLGRVSSVCGRQYGMDRNLDFRKTLLAYQAMVNGVGYPAMNLRSALSAAYRRGENDYNLSPTIIENENGKTLISDNDALIFFNFRLERIQQLLQLFLPEKVKAKIKRPTVPSNLFIVGLSELGTLPVKAAFENPKTNQTLGEVLSKYQSKQLRVAEQEKIAHVTDFFNCINKPFPFEVRTIIKSLKVDDWSKKPEMSAEKITKTVVDAVKSKAHDFILVNFANVDMLAHTGNISATALAVKFVDGCVDRIVKANLAAKGATIITADHGNAEQIMKANANQDPETKHSLNPVPFILITPDNRKNLIEGAFANTPTTLAKIIEAKSSLADIAPTILELMNFPKPEEMTGHSLLKNLE